MKKKFETHWQIYLGVMAVVTIAFFVTRLANLTIIPIFTDEAIYLRWAQIGLHDPRWRFISLIDGKQPLLIWLFYPALKLINDPLVAGRVVSVLAGFTAGAGLTLFSLYKTRSVRGAFIGALLYLCLPFFLLYDRLAVYEALFLAISVWALFLLYLFGKKLTLGIALLLGTVIGFGLLTKSYAQFFLILLPLTLLLVDWPKKERLRVFFKWLGLVTIVIVQSQIYNNILRLSEFRHIIGQKNLQFLWSTTEFVQNPWRGFWGNLQGLGGWLISYLTIPLAILVIVGVVWYGKSKGREAIFFLGFFLIPFMALVFFGKVIYPRFLLFMVPPLLMPTVVCIDHFVPRVKNKLLLLLLIMLLIGPLAYFDLKILTDPIHAPLPSADRQQLINDWPAGYGIKEVITYLDRQSNKGPLVIGTEGTFGLFPMAIELYLGENSNVTTKAYWPLNEFPPDLAQSAKHLPTYLVFKERQQTEANWPIVLIAQYQRGDGPTYLKFFRVTP